MVAIREIPRHIAVIMDGNGRWAEARGLPRIAGHRAGVRAVRAVVEQCARAKVQYLTLFAFSLENWRRPEDEVGALMTLLDRYLKRELSTLMKNNVRLLAIGRTDDLPDSVRKTLNSVVESSSENTGMKLILALSYSGRQDILDAVQNYVGESLRRGSAPDVLDEGKFSSYLATAGIPDPDLLIRTSGEMRISNFLLWQMAYAELFVTEKLWPDFNEQDLIAVLEEFRTRERRFGMTSIQVKSGEKG
jgi:undecaprenyl diphosphate synthase